MTAKVVPFLPVHLEQFKAHSYFENISAEMHQDYIDYVCGYPSYSYIKNGIIIGCYGAVLVGDGRYQLWSILSSESGKCMLGLTREVLIALNGLYFRRVEAFVRADFKEGQRWMDILGFVNETPNGMKKYGDDGRDYYLYAKVK